ncbi:MAG TPA: AI-2E family transporter [Xanthobacteraceae bacterium]|nr:AI-2E family transporter [Xanthobacteraceae bacterium]
MGDAQKPFNQISVDWVIKIGCLAALIYWSLLLLQPFLTIIVWSIILAVVLYPIFDWSVAKLRLHRAVAATAITLLSFFVVLGPATWLGVSLVASLRTIVAQMNAGSLSIPPPWEEIRQWPIVGESLYQFWNLASVNLTAAFSELSPQLKPLGSSLLSIAGSAGISSLQFIAAVAISGFLFVPGPALVANFKTAVNRVATTRGAEFVDLAGATIRNLARGVIGIALLQALLAGLGLIVAGIPAAGLWSFLVLVLGIAQIGATVVLILPIIWAWATMNTTEALIFTAYMGPVAVLDNFLRPLVLAHGLKTPMPVILIGVIGGILVHGVIGVFIGPIVLAIGWELMRAWSIGEIDDHTGDAGASGGQA